MSRPMRWTVAVVAAAVTFWVCLWAARAVSWGWLPKEEETRFAVAIAFATVAATVVAAGVGWWAGREQPPQPEPTVSQRATATGKGRITQVGGSRTPTPATAAPARVDQHAEASDEGSVTQVGGDQHADGGGADDQPTRP
ncbi:hypothetical protein ACH4A8_25010 [Streptomyces vietnamensis]|uniref:hypothetical protein n=1 Tax=Streptomyces vietnamensis TaxID=362257 RepID=UPI0037BB540D